VLDSFLRILADEDGGGHWVTGDAGAVWSNLQGFAPLVVGLPIEHHHSEVRTLSHLLLFFLLLMTTTTCDLGFADRGSEKIHLQGGAVAEDESETV